MWGPLGRLGLAAPPPPPREGSSRAPGPTWGPEVLPLIPSSWTSVGQGAGHAGGRREDTGESGPRAAHACWQGARGGCQSPLTFFLGLF